MSVVPKAPITRLLRPAKAAAKLGISIPTLYRWERSKADFPKRVKLSERVSVYDDAELDAFVAKAGAAA